jgi:hypothetical protein
MPSKIPYLAVFGLNGLKIMMIYPIFLQDLIIILLYKYKELFVMFSGADSRV